MTIVKVEDCNKLQDEVKAGKKYDTGKPDWTLLDFDFLEECVQVLTQGVEKYGRGNWKHVMFAKQRYEAALLRHVTSYIRGEDVDVESKQPTLAHIFCNIMFLRYFDKKVGENE